VLTSLPQQIGPFQKKKLEDKVSFEAFQQIYPDYKGTADIHTATEFIKSKFISCVPGGGDQDNLYVHTMCALDTNAMNTVFESVKDYIWKKRMEDAVANQNF